MQRYFLRRRLIDPQTMLEIDRNTYESLASARKTLVDAFAFEQKFEIVLGNYRDLELAAANWSLSMAIETLQTYEQMNAILIEANRLVVNLLSTTRLYSDQIKRAFRHIAVSPSFKQAAETRLSAAYDASFSYRFMEALRNHVQHRSTPVHKMGPREIVRERTEEWADIYTVYAQRETLEEEGDFKAKILHEMPEEVDLRKAIRKYVTELSKVHIDLRKQIEHTVHTARDLIGETIDYYKNQTGLSTTALCACVGDGGDDSEYSEWIPLFLNWDDVRQNLVSKNQGIRIEVRPRQSNNAANIL